jgi:hypothetical protein
MSLILKQEPANTISTPPAGKSTLFVTDLSVMAVKSPDGNVTTFPTVQGANTQVLFNDDGALNGNANLTFNKTTSTMTVANLSVTGTLNAGDISVSSIANGTSNVDIIGASGNVTTSVGGVANVLVVTGTGANITGTFSTSGNANVGNLGTGGLITATGNIQGANLVTGGVLSVTGNANIGNVGTGGLITATGNIGGGNIITAGIVSATGNVSGNFFIGNGSQLTGIDATAIQNGTANVRAFNNANVTVSAAGVANVLEVTGTGANLTGTFSASGNANVGNLGTGGLITATGNLNAGNIITGGIVSATGNGTFGNVSATTFTGALSGAATTAGTVTTAAQPNITSTGTLASLSVSGNANVGNLGTAALVATGTGSFGANVNMNSFNITSLATPVADTDAATKAYVDTVAQGLDTKASVVAATVANITLSGTQTIDGVAVTAGQRVLVKNQTAPADNGLYLCAAGSWTRTTDMSTWAQVPGAYVFVEGGTTQADTGWVCTSDAGGTIGVTAMTWAQFSGAGSYTAGTGLTLTGSVFSANTSQTQVTAVGTLTDLSVSGNANIGNIGTGGLISATGNLNAGNIITGGIVSATGNGTFGNVSATTFTGALSGAATTAGTVTTNAQPNITSTGTLTTLSVSGNANIGNIGTGGLITATGNITGGNVIGTLLTGTLTTQAQPNITSTGTLASLSVSGNANIGNIGTGGLITATGNITGGNVIGTLLTGTLSTAAQPNITSVGTLSGLTLANASTISVGSNTNVGTFTGNFSLSAGSRLNATYADLAEKYVADATYAPGTVLIFGGDHEVTLATEENSSRVAGVVTTNPAYTMNNDCVGEHVATLALQGRVPVKVLGPIYKGDLLVSGANGYATANNLARAGTIIGKSLENFSDATGTIEVAVGRF